MKKILTTEYRGLRGLDWFFIPFLIACSLATIVFSSGFLVPLLWTMGIRVFVKDLSAKWLCFQFMVSLFIVMLIKQLLDMFFVGPQFYGYLLIAILAVMYIQLIAAEKYKV